jgi:hypothetical protein
MRDPDCPLFLEGTFLFDENGYRFCSEPPLDLMSSAAVSSGDPWIALAAALEHAKAGNHEHVSKLLARVRRDTAPGLVLAVTALVGDAGRERDVEGLLALMDKSQPDYTRVVACKAAAHSGYIWTAPSILECWRTIAPRERGEIELSLALLLEREESEISDAFRFEDELGYIEFVLERTTEIFSKYGDSAIWHALPIQGKRIVSEMAKIIQQLFRSVNDGRKHASVNLILIPADGGGEHDIICCSHTQ